MFSSWANALFGGEGRNGNEPITTKSTERGRIDKGGMGAFAFSGMQGWRMTMEDAHLVCTNIPVHQGSSNDQRSLSAGHAIFGVFDGHGGDFTANYTAGNFLEVFSKSAPLKKYAKMVPSEQGNVPGLSLLKQALTDTFCQLDIHIRKVQHKRNETIMAWGESDPERMQAGRTRMERSGSTIVVVMVTPSHILCANAGDSRAVLRKGGRVLPLSFDHKPSNVPELERINAAGGYVKGKRVDGDLAVSRGLGDFSYKSIEGLPVRDQKVIPHPEFCLYPRDPSRDEFVILACDGIWDVATNDECAEFVQALFEEGENDLGLICEEALDTCLEKHSRDNMTMAIVTFDGAQIAKGAMSGNNAVWKRRTARKAREFERSAKLVASKAAAGVGLSFGSGEQCVSQTAIAGFR